MSISEFNRALRRIPKRAEKQEDPKLHETFFDSGIAEALDNFDNEILYGRRGTGKTHALSYLATEKTNSDDLAVFLDLRLIGSPGQITGTQGDNLTDRAVRLLIDLLSQLRESIQDEILNNDVLVDNEKFTQTADRVLSTLTDFSIEGQTESESRTSSDKISSSGANGEIGITPKPGIRLGGKLTSESQVSSGHVFSQKGVERQKINFGSISKAFRDFADALDGRRLWIFLDEWSSVPLDLQPYLGEFLLRCILPLRMFTVKIAAIEQQSTFTSSESGSRVGLEIGADIAATVSLDDYLVYEGNENRASAFFKNLTFKHLTAESDDGLKALDLFDPDDVVRSGFRDTRAFDELVRAAEGVPRDFLHMAAKCAMDANDKKISIDNVRNAAKMWYTSDKIKSLEGQREAIALLNWINDRVIKNKRARAFLVSDSVGNDPLLSTLFYARVLHVVKRGYSAQDQPGQRFNVWSIDYGAYVDLIRTKYAPVGVLPIEGLDGAVDYADLEVPVQDLRAIRRAVLDLSEFYAKA